MEVVPLLPEVGSRTLAVAASVGTDHHPFERLVGWVDAWAGANRERFVVMQYGTSGPPTRCVGSALVAHNELLEVFSRSGVVVSHGGPSTVMDARMVGRLPIVVARNPEFGEHVDGHQMRFAHHLRRHELAVVVDTEAEFVAALDMAMVEPERFRVPVDQAAIRGVVEFGRLMDHLLGTTTPITPSSPAGAEEPFAAPNRGSMEKDHV